MIPLQEIGLILIIWISASNAVRILPWMLDLPSQPPSYNSLSLQNVSQRSIVQSPDDHLVQSLPYLDTSTFRTKHYAGHLPASPDESDKQMFYWLFAPDFGNSNSLDSEEIPLILWLNGGPGCSSMIGLFIENGPFHFHVGENKKYNFDENAYSWHKAPAWVLYVDQPVGTGLSYTTKNNYCDTDLKINTDFYYFLNQFFLLHRQTFLVETEHGALMVNRRLYFTGESHAGHYIPSMMDFILQQNENILASTSNNMDVVIMPLSGAAIGNGWIHPYYQYSGAEATHLMGLIDQAQRRHLDEAEIKCQSRLDAKILDGSQCLSLIDDIVSNSNGQGGFTVNSYDVSLNKIGRYPPGLDLIENYFGLKVWVNPPMDDINTEMVLQALHASGFTKHGPYRVCADKPYYALAHQDGLGVTEELTRVLDHPSRPKILIYNGMRDIVCNHVGTERTLDNLHWHGNADWIVAQRYTFSSGSTRPVGFVKEFDNLIFLKIPQAGHMVPFDQPEVSLEMIRRLVYNIGFGTMVQELELRTPGNSSLTECPHCSSCDNESDSTTNLGGNASVIATKSYTYIGSLVVGFAVGVGLSCLIYCLLSYIHKIQGPRTKPYPVSPMEIEDGVGSMS